ncbi:sialidase family protein [Azospirillum sp. SYSU D00513]|uniref:sialidase family protein n=1 Tax=Azospirillum sp. SYSU D00513 TaxID=2812561 RepID=UPI001A9699A4|nr:sialidase family protein [Azospirillum sp. SYSU D00513]
MTSRFSVSHGTVYRDPFFYASFPSIAALPDGAALVAFRRARDHRWLRGEEYRRTETGLKHVDHLDSRSQIVLLRLDREGRAAGDPLTLPPDPQAADQDPSLLVLRDGRVLLTGFCWYPLPAKEGEALRALGAAVVGSPQQTGDIYLFWGAYARWSDDGGRSWSPHRFLPPLPGHGDVVPGMRRMLGGALRGRAVELPDGTILQATYTFHPGNGRYASHLYASADRGESWEYRSLIAIDGEKMAGFCESALALAADGRLIAFHRTTGLDDRLATSVSRDGGHSWEPWRVQPVIGHPFDACPLPDGRLLVVGGYRHEPFGVRARLWDPARGEIGDAPEIILRDDAASADVGYPWAAALPDGRVMAVYYMCDADGVRHVAGTVLTLG